MYQNKNLNYFYKYKNKNVSNKRNINNYKNKKI